jgi:hypothetical protein
VRRRQNVTNRVKERRTRLGRDLEEAFIELTAGLRGEVELDQYEVAESSRQVATAKERHPPSPGRGEDTEPCPPQAGLGDVGEG